MIDDFPRLSVPGSTSRLDPQWNRLPNLNALRTFVVAAKHCNFRAAADELNLTHSAVSHQIKALEDQLQVALFVRVGRRVELSQAGNSYLPIVADALVRIADGTRMIQTFKQTDTFVLQVFITMAVQWLMPLLHDFQEQHPNIKVQLSTAYDTWEFDRFDVDAGIVLTRNPAPDLVNYHLTSAQLTPLCHRRYLDPNNPDQIRTPDDLFSKPLVQHAHCPDDWAYWAEHNRLAPPDVDKAMVVDTYLVAFESALARGAITLANLPFNTSHSPDLVEPFPNMRTSGGDWYLTCRPDMADHPNLHQFLNWLRPHLPGATHKA